MSVASAHKASVMMLAALMMARAESEKVVYDTPVQVVAISNEEIRAWNAAVDAKKAARRERRKRKGQ